jgi:hypothetical protein
MSSVVCLTVADANGAAAESSRSRSRSSSSRSRSATRIRQAAPSTLPRLVAQSAPNERRQVIENCISARRAYRVIDSNVLSTRTTSAYCMVEISATKEGSSLSTALHYNIHPASVQYSSHYQYLLASLPFTARAQLESSQLLSHLPTSQPGPVALPPSSPCSS